MFDSFPTEISLLGGYFYHEFRSFGSNPNGANKQKIRCVCLGAVFNFPTSTLTIIENSAMVVIGIYFDYHQKCIVTSA